MHPYHGVMIEESLSIFGLVRLSFDAHTSKLDAHTSKHDAHTSNLDAHARRIRLMRAQCSCIAFLNINYF